MVALGERSTPNGQELLAEFIQYGHQKPFEEIVRRYAGMVYNVCYRITKDKHEAEDATQAVFLTLALQAKRGADIKALGPWLQQVAKRLSLDTQRSKKRRQNREERHQAEQTVRRESLLDDALPSADLDELKTILHEELQKLPAKYRLPLILHYFGGLTREEMAVELNCKPSTLGVRIFRGREMLAGRLSSRGIHISAGMLAAVLGFAVKRAVSDTLIASTSHAATAMLAGYDGAGFASAHVIGLTRRATGALALGKVRIAAITLMMAGTSLGAGAKVLGILPQIDVRQILTDQLKRMVRPLMEPFSQPLHVDAQTQPVRTTVASASPQPAAQDPLANVADLITRTSPSAKADTKPAVASNADSSGNGGIFIKTSSAPLQSAWTHAAESESPASELAAGSSGTERSLAADKSADDADTITASASSGSSGAGGAGGLGTAAAAYHFQSPGASTSVNSFRGSDLTLAINDLVVGSPSTSASSTAHDIASSASVIATPTSLIQIPTIGGTVTQSSAGTVRGWGTIDRTGVLQMNGKVVADGQGVDRTLNLTSFTSVQTGTPGSSSSSASAVSSAATSIASGAATGSAGSAMAVALPTLSTASSSTGTVAGTTGPIAASSNAAAAAPPGSATDYTLTTATVSPQLCGDGWYAIDHGRLSLPLLNSSSNHAVFTWGDNPQAPALSLVNSVRVTLAGSTGTTATTGTASNPAPLNLSLLSTDRTDVPNRYQLTGAPIGLWQVDPSGPNLAAADLTVDYNSVLANLLDASPSSVQLWTFSDDTNAWQPVAPSSFSLDTQDHLVSGFATDINDFAVTVDPPPGQDVDQVLASHLAELSDDPAAVNNPSIGGPAVGGPAVGGPAASNPATSVQVCPSRSVCRCSCWPVPACWGAGARVHAPFQAEFLKDNRPGRRLPCNGTKPC